MISHHCHNIIIAASYTLITCSRHWSFCYRITAQQVWVIWTLIHVKVSYDALFTKWKVSVCVERLPAMWNVKMMLNFTQFHLFLLGFSVVGHILSLTKLFLVLALFSALCFLSSVLFLFSPYSGLIAISAHYIVTARSLLLDTRWLSHFHCCIVIVTFTPSLLQVIVIA